MRTTALSSAGRADGGGGEPAGGGGVYAQSGSPGGTGAVGAGAFCCARTTVAPKTADAIAMRAPCVLFMILLPVQRASPLDQSTFSKAPLAGPRLRCVEFDGRRRAQTERLRARRLHLEVSRHSGFVVPNVPE